jgi:pyruvate dehydrogenase E2 component (dihydrolipoamide acetyltransferase)
MSAGAHETAPVTLTTRCDATNLVSLRDQFRAAERGAEEIVPSYNDLLVKLTAMILTRHLLLAAQWGEREILLPDGFHISVAVDTDAGLLAPVVRDADKLTLRQVAAELRWLAASARSGGLSADEMQGGVFTITNLGMLGVEAFTPIINLPQCAILGVGRIVREPAVVNDQIVPRDRMTLSLTFDHRVVDGAPAARFLNDLRHAIENPGAVLVP